MAARGLLVSAPATRFAKILNHLPQRPKELPILRSQVTNPKSLRTHVSRILGPKTRLSRDFGPRVIVAIAVYVPPRDLKIKARPSSTSEACSEALNPRLQGPPP